MMVFACGLPLVSKRTYRTPPNQKPTRRYVVPGCRIRTSSLGKSTLFHAPSMQHPREAHVSFDAARLVINSVLLVALPGELLLGGPWPRPHGRIFDRDLVREGLWPAARPALNQVQVLA